MRTKKFRCNVIIVCLVFIMSLPISSCVSTRGWVIDVGVNNVADDIIDSLMDFRSVKLVKEGIAGTALLLSAVAELSPNSKKTLSLCSMLYVAYAALTFEKDQNYALELAELAEFYGFRAIRLNEDIAEKLDEGFKFAQPIKSIDEVMEELGKDTIDFDKDMTLVVDLAEEDDVDAVTWLALAIGLKGGLNAIIHGDMSVMGQLGDIMSMIKKSRALNPEYFFGLTTIIMAGYYAMVPKMIDPKGGLESAEAMLAEAEKINGEKFILLDMFKAAVIAPLKKDEALFESLLQGVIASDPSVPKGTFLLNILAKEYAQKILDNKDMFF